MMCLFLKRLWLLVICLKSVSCSVFMLRDFTKLSVGSAHALRPYRELSFIRLLC